MNSKLIVCIFIVIVSMCGGCIFFTESKYYIGSYEIRSDVLTEYELLDSALAMTREIASCANYYVKHDTYDGNYRIISLSPVYARAKDSEALRLSVSMQERDDFFSVDILNFQPQETEEIVRLRKCIEEALSRHPDLKWKYYLAHRALNI